MWFFFLLYLDQRSAHPVQEALGEPGSLVSAGGVDDPLGAVEVLLEGAAEQLHVLLAVLLGHISLVLVQALDPDLVVVGATLVAGLDSAHAGGVAEIV